MVFARVVATVLTCLALNPSLAQETYPSKPVRLVSPFPAAGPLDVMARLYALLRRATVPARRLRRLRTAPAT